MMIWLDAQLSPMTAKWINEQYLNLKATPLRELNLLRASDHGIFQKAKASNAILITKDRDFLKLLNLYGPPPQIIWLRIGNSSNSFLQEVLSSTLLKAINILKAGDPWVEIRFKPKGETQKQNGFDNCISWQRNRPLRALRLLPAKLRQLSGAGNRNGFTTGSHS